MTHDELRKRAVQWLTRTKRCGVVISEMVSGCREIPDAIGWKYSRSIVVECKTSRGDWRADKGKSHVHAGRGVGDLRYYLCPCGVLAPEDLRGSDYGLLTASDSGIQVRKPATPREAYLPDEITMLVSALRRVKAREFLVLVPESDAGGEAGT
jgi:hypothetical protein